MSLSTHHPLHQGLKPRVHDFHWSTLEIFLPIIHYTKDWNSLPLFSCSTSSSFYPSSTTPRIETFSFLLRLLQQQCFLPIIHYTKDWNPLGIVKARVKNTLSTHHPLHQGLKQLPKQLMQVHVFLSTHHPLHQGLKHWSKSFWFAHSGQLSTHHPLHQGLKLGEGRKSGRFAMLSTHHPLHQGLKLRLLLFFSA